MSNALTSEAAGSVARSPPVCGSCGGACPPPAPRRGLRSRPRPVVAVARVVVAVLRSARLGEGGGAAQEEAGLGTPSRLPKADLDPAGRLE
ncbi:hypothetical protein [Streptomyces sp. NPDC051677]|uniref:hypothetical protein n=1 Tax=Streptomyces sp. NPDC051677 TaxID=3365669 RepID=UPI0037D8DE17